jgi:hypothetical protein
MNKICLCADNQACALCEGMDDPHVIAASDDVLCTRRNVKHKPRCVACRKPVVAGQTNTNKQPCHLSCQPERNYRR